MIANLHNHSVFSDGTSSPENIARMGKENNIELISLTDHNTFDGYERFEKACQELNLKFVRGIELDAVEPDMQYQSELLAYFPDGGSQKINDIVEYKKTSRTERVKRALSRASETFKVQTSYESLQALEIKEKGFLGILSNKLTYRYLLSLGINLPDYTTLQETAQWREIWSMKEIPQEFTLLEMIERINKAGGYPVLPHFGYHCKLSPFLMRENQKIYLDKLDKMKQAGLWGIEQHPYQYVAQAHEINSIIEQWAAKTDLKTTFGSDFHGGMSAHNRFDAMKGDFKGFFY